MDWDMYNVIYLDERAPEDRTWLENTSTQIHAPMPDRGLPSQFSPTVVSPIAEIESTVKSLLAVFPKVHVCRTGSECLARLARAENTVESELNCTFVVIHVPLDEMKHARSTSSWRSPSPTSREVSSTESFNSIKSDPDELLGMDLLLHIASEKRAGKISARTLPVVLLSAPQPELTFANIEQTSKSKRATRGVSWGKEVISLQYHEAGAVDVVSSPVTLERVRGLPSHAYRTLCDAKFATPRPSRAKKGSWMGVEHQQAQSQPYAYLREEMVSDLMDRICDPERDEYPISSAELNIDPRRRDTVATAIGGWSFSAHEFNDDELLYAASLILQHALAVPEVIKWQLSSDEITIFLIACRRVYNSFVLYHNFRHACDVLQATFLLLISIGALPVYHPSSSYQSSTMATTSSANSLQPQPPHSSMSTLLTPFHCLALLIAAIGHDVGHPGVNNNFLVTLNTPLAQLYNDRSVLESFHCAAYSQILRRHWPAAFKDTAMRKLMINSILATDMGVHGQYMTQAGQTYESFSENGHSLTGLTEQKLDEHRELLCCLIIKCADICNVSRKYETATKWAFKLTDEFSNQAAMEQELKMPTCLLGGPPVRDDMIKMGTGQIGFMNYFVIPLFEATNKLLPGVDFAINETKNNRAIWQGVIDAAKVKLETQPLHSHGSTDFPERAQEIEQKPLETLESTNKQDPILKSSSITMSESKSLRNQTPSKSTVNFSSSSPNVTSSNFSSSNHLHTASSNTTDHHRPSTGPTPASQPSQNSLRRHSSCGSLISASRRHSINQQLRELDSTSDEQRRFLTKNGTADRIKNERRLRAKISLQGFKNASQKPYVNGDSGCVPSRRSDLAFRLREKLTLSFWKQRKLDKAMYSD